METAILTGTYLHIRLMVGDQRRDIDIPLEALNMANETDQMVMVTSDGSITISIYD